MNLTDERPCYVDFKEVAIEDRNASIAAGHSVSKTIHMAIITPPGRGDNVEKVAEEWLESKRQCGDKFYKHYSECYRAWKDQQEMPLHGTAMKLWPAASPSQIDQCLRANVKTVEDLAAANQQALQAIGMGAQGLQQQARTWLSTAKDVGQAASQITAMKQQIADLTEQLAAKDTIIAGLQAQLSAASSRAHQPEPAMH